MATEVLSSLVETIIEDHYIEPFEVLPVQEQVEQNEQVDMPEEACVPVSTELLQTPANTELNGRTLLGKGAFCRVFSEMRQGQLVAVKILSIPTVRQQVALLEESKILFGCNHPNIIKPLPNQIARGAAGIKELVMPLYPIDLCRWTSETPSRSSSLLTNILSKLFSALDHLASSGYIHGDIKPANVLLTLPQCEPILIDFNLSKPITPAKDIQLMLKESDADTTGTPLWMSPERLAFPRLYHPASDVWAAGLVGYFLFSGEEPWPEYNNRDLFFRDLRLGHLIQKLIKPDTCPQSVWQALNYCWMSNFSQRHTSQSLISVFAELSENHLLN